MLVKTRKRPAAKLDEWLREGASGKKPALDIDRQLASATNRLMKEKLPFKKEQNPYDVTQIYKDSGFIILDREKEEAAIQLIANLVASNQLPASALIRVQGDAKKAKKTFWKGKQKKKNKQKKKV
ncbi:hypothetical protein NECAME_05186 [Necator americanus]|uniref:Uncharacterized protein n=1 Tax=Necator americanus TaxID=51031 RepID=W2SIW8_NECAM|nr:hypothetical protein NECAME_05186 [Necator americanus]ETN69604.1 hypothetical protein NECAME_05186 [Necator americanus]